MSASRALPDASHRAVVVEQVLPRPLGHHDHRVPPLPHPLAQRGQEAAGPSSRNGTSGISTKSTSWLASAA